MADNILFATYMLYCMLQVKSEEQFNFIYKQRSQRLVLDSALDHLNAGLGGGRQGAVVGVVVVHQGITGSGQPPGSASDRGTGER